MRVKKKKNNSGLLKTLGSLQFGITVLATIAIVSIAGTVLPQGQGIEFYREHFGPLVNLLITVFRFDITYRSLLFIGLLGLFALNLVLCSLIKFPARLRMILHPDITPDVKKISGMPVTETIQNKSLDDIKRTFADSGFQLRPAGSGRLYGEKGRLGYLGSTFVHISILVFIAGGLVSLLTGQRGYIILEKGQSASAMTIADNSTVPLGFELKLDRFEVEFYEDYPRRPKSYTSYLTVSEPPETVFDVDIRMNHPLMRHGFTVYQSSYGLSEKSGQSAVNDTARVAIGLRDSAGDMPPIITFDMVPGEHYPVPGFGDSLSVSIAELHRNFTRIQSVSGETNPAVRLDVSVHDEPRWSMYAFQNFPGMNMPMAPDLDLLFTMLDLRPAAGNGGTEDYYTVLGVKKDSGIPLMWAGAVIMMLGMVFSFYIRPRRIWVYDNNGSVMIGARAKGETELFREFIRRTVKKL